VEPHTHPRYEGFFPDVGVVVLGEAVSKGDGLGQLSEADLIGGSRRASTRPSLATAPETSRREEARKSRPVSPSATMAPWSVWVPTG